ncbi:nitroreductase family protein [Scopulibacillus cellulosilyticus]|uniref:Nitroreductase family protein n=1 Tax=Scopulibacillus cellulosilyticus TaxID=2665665 RepID=A0ABW2PT91_9BACL
MDVFKAIKNRREITNFQDKPIPEEHLEQLLNAGYLAPSGNNLPSREFILVRENETLEHLSHATPYVPWLGKAEAAIVVTGCHEVSKYWLQDASIACGFIWLLATHLELGTAFGAIYHADDAEESERRESYVREKLNIPEDRRIVAILGLGYPQETPKPKQVPPKESIIFYDQFKKI